MSCQESWLVPRVIDLHLCVVERHSSELDLFLDWVDVLLAGDDDFDAAETSCIGCVDSDDPGMLV